MINFSPYQNISFQGGLKKNLRKSERVYSEYKKEYPYINSYTLWRQRIQNIENKKGIELKRARMVNDITEDLIENNREHAQMFLDCDYDLFLTIEKKHMKDEHIGNCGECADVMREYLKKDFPDVKVVCLSMFDAKREHVFCVVGMDSDAKISKPSTWGNKAVVVDSWRNIISSVPDAIREYENLYGVQYSESDMSFGISEIPYFE